MRAFFWAALLAISADSAWAASIGQNPIYVQSMAGGSGFYARCIPAEKTGSKGKTVIYSATAETEQATDKIDEYPWYCSQGVVLGWSPIAGKVAVMAGFLDGQEGKEPAGLSFYLGGKLLKAYSLANLGAMGIDSRPRPGFPAADKRPELNLGKWVQVGNSNRYYFSVATHDNREFRFDILTGELYVDADVDQRGGAGPREKKDPTWSEARQGLAIKLEAVKKRYKVGDDVEVVFTFKNVSSAPFRVPNAKDRTGSFFHQFTFADAKGKAIAFVGPGENFLDMNEYPMADLAPQGTTQHKVVLNPWKLAGLGHDYTEIGAEARTIVVTGIYSTRAGLTFKDPTIWGGGILAPPITIEIAP